MAASLAKGTTVIENAAREPEIGDVADCLNKMGAKITGAGTSRIVVEGVARLARRAPRGAARPHRDRHLCDGGGHGRRRRAVAERASPNSAGALDVLVQAGVAVTPTNDGIRVARNGAGLAPVEVATAPFPGFPTDLQAQFMALMTPRQRHLAHHRNHLREPLHACAGAGAARRPYPSRRPDAPPSRASTQLKGAPVMATDLRASVSLVIAALAAEGETIVNRVYHLDRGFERLEDKLAALRRRHRAD